MLNFFKKIIEGLNPKAYSKQNEGSQQPDYQQQYYQQPSLEKDRWTGDNVVFPSQKQTASGVKADWIEPGKSVSIAGLIFQVGWCM